MTDYRFALIGAGGTGSILLEPLTRYLNSSLPPTLVPGDDTPIQPPDWMLAVIDGDDFAPTNVDRQIFGSAQVGMNKATAATIATVNRVPQADEHLRAVPEYLGEANIAQLLPDGVFVLIAVDSYRTRAIIEEHANKLDNVTVINGGNEYSDGSCQIWTRREGKHTTPPISFLHPEIHSGGADRSLMSCQAIAELPGGGQLIIANMMSAAWMLAALHKVLTGQIGWTDLTFDFVRGKAAGMNGIALRGWQ